MTTGPARCALAAALALAPAMGRGAGDWPPAARECRPHAYWWWLGSAADKANLTRELERYRAAGMGGVHIIPIYGAKGWEDRYVRYLTPAWLELLNHAVAEGRRLDLNVDMTTGTGWCFGGPGVTAAEACATVTPKVQRVPAGAQPEGRFDAGTVLVGFGPDGAMADLTGRLDAQGRVAWRPEGGPGTLYALTQKPTSRVKRAAPGGEGYMLNLFHAPAMEHYLAGFDAAFKGYGGLRPRAMYHDSYEYNGNWAPDLFAQFEKRRGYSLKRELPALFGDGPEDDRRARVRCDIRETLSDLLAEETLPRWADWCRAQGLLTRNQAHGSPGNLLDLYALVDIPETEMFSRDRSKLVSKFASSAAHVMGRRLVSAETGTWLREHFTETLGDMKSLLDDLFLSGVNHVFYHGTCYSPDEVPWPGWLFYASYEMNPRNPVWHDVPALNAYAARCQSVLQDGTPDADALVYWPIHAFWRTPGALEQKLTVHHRDWLEKQPVGALAAALWSAGFAFDFISDRQLAHATADAGGIALPGGRYHAIVVPETRHIPVETLARLMALARSGTAVVFENRLPEDVPGLARLEEARAQLARLLQEGGLRGAPAAALQRGVNVGRGKVLVHAVAPALEAAGIRPEPLMRVAGLSFVRRAHAEGQYYFVANETDKPFAGWVGLARDAQALRILDPLTGEGGGGLLRRTAEGTAEIYLQLAPEESLILKTFREPQPAGAAWAWRKPGQAHPLAGTWEITFAQGGPELPPAFRTDRLASWTELGGAEAQRFAGTAVYRLAFDAPAANAGEWFLDLGRACQSARVRLNGRELGTVFLAPFRVRVPAGLLQPAGNRLEVEVTNVAANRIRDLDRRKVPWKTFHDINFVNINYKPFDASDWPLHESGLLGPVALVESRP